MRHSLVFIAACVAVALMPGCGKKSMIDRSQGVDPVTEFRAAIVENIQDPDTRTKILDIVDQGEAKLQEFYQFYEQHRERMESLSSDYNATREDLEKAMSELNARYRELALSMVADRFAIKDLTTHEEWEAIARAERSLLTD